MIASGGKYCILNVNDMETPTDASPQGIYSLHINLLRYTVT